MQVRILPPQLLILYAATIDAVRKTHSANSPSQLELREESCGRASQLAMATVLKTDELQGLEGSTPSPSADFELSNRSRDMIDC